MRFRDKPQYSFDDVLLVPQHSKVASRQDVGMDTQLGSMALTLPLLSSNMDSVTEGRMARAMGKAGGAGVLHRFATGQEVMEWVQDCDTGMFPAPIIISVGLDLKPFNGGADLVSVCAEYEVDAVCVDVAHGDHERVLETVETLRKLLPVMDIIAGNVATGMAAMRLREAGANIIKVGIGPGSVCSTRIVSGHGVPQLSAIIDVFEETAHLRDPGRMGISIIADGGIRYPGDIVKALAAGADAVMLGSLLAGTDEAPGERIMEHGVAYKTYRGMASREVQREKRNGRKPRVEGVSAKVPYRGPVSDTLDNLEAGIRSGLSYSGANTLAELRDAAEFVVVTGNTLKENHPHHPYKL
jgi:IMP dehydrogenase